MQDLSYYHEKQKASFSPLLCQLMEGAPMTIGYGFAGTSCAVHLMAVFDFCGSDFDGFFRVYLILPCDFRDGHTWVEVETVLKYG